MLRKLAFTLICAVRPRPGPRPHCAADRAPGNSVFLPLIAKPVSGPVLKWQHGGCYSSWCETGWYSSPAVINIDGDPQAEIIASAYSLVALDGETGALQWRAGNTNNRTWPGIVLADIDQDGQTEIVTAQSGPYVSAYRLDGTLKWQKQPSGAEGEYRGLLVADLDNNGSSLEVVVTRAAASEVNTWVLNSAGNPVGGKWPQMNDSTGYAWGVYNANAAVQGAPIWSRTFQAAGMAPTVIAYNEVYNAIQNGVIAAGENEAAGVEQMKFYEVAPHLSMTQHAITIRPLCFSGKTFDKLDKALQAAVLKAGKEAGAYGRQIESSEDEAKLVRWRRRASSSACPSPAATR